MQMLSVAGSKSRAYCKTMRVCGKLYLLVRLATHLHEVGD